MNELPSPLPSRFIHWSSGLPSAAPELERWRTSGKLIRGNTKKKNMNWYLEVLMKYAGFDGRAALKEYWYFMRCPILVRIEETARRGNSEMLVLNGRNLWRLCRSAISPYFRQWVERVYHSGRKRWPVRRETTPTPLIFGGAITCPNSQWGSTIVVAKRPQCIGPPYACVVTTERTDKLIATIQGVLGKQE